VLDIFLCAVLSLDPRRRIATEFGGPAAVLLSKAEFLASQPSLLPGDRCHVPDYNKSVSRFPFADVDDYLLQVETAEPPSVFSPMYGCVGYPLPSGWFWDCLLSGSVTPSRSVDDSLFLLVLLP